MIAKSTLAFVITLLVACSGPGLTSLPGGNPGAATACRAILAYVQDCNEGERQECEREYAEVAAPNRAVIDRYVQCAEQYPLAGCDKPPRWGHGACQGQQGATASTIPTDPAIVALRCVVAADDYGGIVGSDGCHRSDGSRFSCLSQTSGGGEFGQCCVGVPGEVACFFSDFTNLNLHSN